MKAIISTSTSIQTMSNDDFIELAVTIGEKKYTVMATDDGLHIQAKSQIIVTPTGVDSIAVDCA